MRVHEWMPDGLTGKKMEETGNSSGNESAMVEETVIENQVCNFIILHPRQLHDRASRSFLTHCFCTAGTGEGHQLSVPKMEEGPETAKRGD